MDGLFTSLQVLAQEHRGDLAANISRGASLVGCECNGEAGNTGWQTVRNIGLDGRDGNGFAHFDELFRDGRDAGVQSVAFDDRLQAGTTHDLFFERSQATTHVGAQDRLHVFIRHVLLLNDHQSLRCVLFGHDLHDREGQRRDDEDGQQQRPTAPLQDVNIVVKYEFTMPKHLVYLFKRSARGV